MAFNNFRVNFEFQGKLEVLKDGVDSKGKEVKGTVRDNGKGFIKLVFKGKTETQGDFYFEVNGFSNPVKFTLNETDNKGVNKIYDFNGGKLKYDESEIKDLWKSTYKLKKGETEQIFYHGKDFVNTLIKLMPNIEKLKNAGYIIKGIVDRNPYKGNMMEKFTVTSLEILPKVEKSYLKVIEVFGYKREELKGSTIIPYEIISINTKDKGRKDFYYKSNKKLKLDSKWLLGGSMESIPLTENPVIMSYIKDLGENELGKIKVHYKPVVNTTKEEKTDYKADLETLPNEFKISYEMLMAKGLEQQARQMVERVVGSIKLSEGGGFRDYFIDEFEYSTDLTLKVSEALSKREFLETNISKIDTASKKENKGKMLLSTIAINQENNIIDVNSDTDIFNTDNEENSFDTALNSDDETLVENDTAESTLDTDSFEEFTEKEEEKKKEEQQVKDDNVEEEFEEIFEVNKTKAEKEEKPKKVVKEEKVEEVKEEEEEEEDLFSKMFNSY